MVDGYFPLYIDEGELTFDKTGKLISPKNNVHYEKQEEGFSIALDVDFEIHLLNYLSPSLFFQSSKMVLLLEDWMVWRLMPLVQFVQTTQMDRIIL